MSWCVNKGPSFDTVLQSNRKLNGFFQRFTLDQDDNRMTPGKRQLKHGKGTKQVVYSDAIPKGQPMPVYSGFSNIKNKATSTIKKSGKKLKKRNIK